MGVVCMSYERVQVIMEPLVYLLVTTVDLCRCFAYLRQTLTLLHGCLVAIFLCLVGLRGARLIRGREQKNISSWWTPYYLLLILVLVY